MIIAAITVHSGIMPAAEVMGQIVRLEAPAGNDAALREIAVYSAGQNIARDNPAVTIVGSGFNGNNGKPDNNYRKLNDGKEDILYLNSGKRVPGTDESNSPVGVWVEVDLHAEQPLERIVVTEDKTWDERGPRLLTVLDAGRRVVFQKIYNVSAPDFKGRIEIAVVPGTGSLSGRVVPPASSQWAPLGDLLDVKQGSWPQDAAARATSFEQRNSPSVIAELAKAFFARMDLAKPGLADVRAAFSAGDHQKALDLYRDHFLKKVQGIAYRFISFPAEAPYVAAGDDLLRGVNVIFSRHGVAAESFKPGVIDWTSLPGGVRSEGIELARSRATAGVLQRPLLSAYRRTGNTEYLRQWEAITDDWGMNYLAACAQTDYDLRDYFLWHLLQVGFIGQELAQTAQLRPDFAKTLSSTTLARLLMPMVEEYPASLWLVARRTNFDHLANSLWFSIEADEVLDDFYAGERLQQEDRQQWHRICDTWLLQDGTPQLMSGAGYQMFTILGIGIGIRLLSDAPPAWFTDDLKTRVSHAWRLSLNYPLRFMTPDGTMHGAMLFRDPGGIWSIRDNLSDPGLQRIPIEDTGPFFHDPQIAGMFQEAYGAGRDPATLPSWNHDDDRKAIYKEVTSFFGTTDTPPTVTSDYLPYAGVSHLRTSWKSDAMFLEMSSHPQGHVLSGGVSWKADLKPTQTAIEFWDAGRHLYSADELRIDGQPQFPYAGTQRWNPGSKTHCMGMPHNPDPIPARWYTSSALDYTESWYDGAYQDYKDDTDSMARDPKGIYGARADRRIIFLKQLHLVIATDLLHLTAGTHQLTMQERFGIIPALADPAQKTKPTGDLTGTVEGRIASITLAQPNGPGVVVHHVASTPLAWESDDQAASGKPTRNDKQGRLAATASGDWQMVSLIATTSPGGKPAVIRSAPLDGDGIVGFTADLADGGTLTWATTAGRPAALKAGTVEATGESLLVIQHGARLQGLVLGATALRIDGHSTDLAQPDIVFERDQDMLTAHPIYRPIDPVEFAPQATVFTTSDDITLSSRTSGVQIRYTTDGSEPTVASTLYTAPIHIDRDTYLRARAYRPGATDEPFAVAGTTVTAVSDVTYHKRPSKPATTANGLVTGLDWEAVQGTWFALFSHLNLPEVMPAAAHGQTDHLLDVSMRPGDGPFGVRYQGYIDIPASGIWTFRAPEEYIESTCEPGYDLRLWIDGEEWNLTQETQGLGTWSVPLDQGTHRLLVTFADARNRQRIVEKSGLWLGYPRPNVVWKKEASPISIAGPGHDLQPIPDAWLKRSEHP